MQIYKWSLFTMYVLCLIVLSLLILKMVKEAVINTHMEGRLDSIEKEMIQLKRTNKILKNKLIKYLRINNKNCDWGTCEKEKKCNS